MSCSRCQGCMIKDYLLDMEDSSGPMWLQAWRCMNCGNVFDSVFEHNRQTHGAKPIPIPKEFPLSINAEVLQGSSEEMTRLVA